MEIMWKFSKMNVLHLILLYGSISIVFCTNENFNQALLSEITSDPEDTTEHSFSKSPLSHLRIKVMIDNGEPEHFNLKSVTRSLANKYLPVWKLKPVAVEKSKGKSGNQLELMPEVMKRLGEFTFYQESTCISSAVYFHRDRQFFGMLDFRYVIQGLSRDDVNSLEETELWLDKSAIVSREKFIGHRINESRKRKEKANAMSGKRIRNRRSYSYDGYPEILVIVSWELAQKLMEILDESQDYSSIVRYVLTLFNGVDLMYSKLRDTKLELNIAGIIFGTDPESFTFMKDCVAENDNMERHKGRVTYAECSNDKLRKYLYHHRKVISPNSYDTVIFLTSNTLLALASGTSDVNKAKRKRIKGQAACYKENFYIIRKTNEPLILVATIREDGSLGSYSDIAHELAHLMTIKHDPSPLFKDECRANIMKSGSDWFHLGGGWCKTCLSWSDTSEQSFKSFFSSRDCCTFTNKPGSLNPPGHKQKLTADQQCQCYGLDSAKPLYDKQQADQNFCRTPLQCLGVDNEFHNTVLPMNGTPCNRKKVCWEKLCRTITNSKPERLL